MTTSAAVTITVTRLAEVFFIHTDHLNTPRLITNNIGQPAWRWDNNDPFGANVPDENPSGLGVFTCNLRLPGQYFDRETNLHYNYFRDYDPSIGRYVQSDPIGLRGGLNTYAYVAGNPLSQSDLLGLDVTIKYFPGAPGHIGVGINSSETVGLYPVRQTIPMMACSTVPGVVARDHILQKEKHMAQASTIVIKTALWQDALMQNYIDRMQEGASQAYNLCVDQCHSFVQSVLNAGGVSRPENSSQWFPATYYDALQTIHGGQRR